MEQEGEPLTGRQKEILEFLIVFQEQKGRTPTGPEIAEAFGFRDSSSAYQHLETLARKGYLTIEQLGRRKPMAIRLSRGAREMFSPSWPLLGQIPAGGTTELTGEAGRAIHRIEDLLPNLQPGDYFLEVTGDSMIEAGIQPGERVILRPGMTPQPGDICAVWVEGEGGTLKRVYFENGDVWLCPANKAYQPKKYSGDRVRVQGVLISSFSIHTYRK